jgi:hypothetical protein
LHVFVYASIHKSSATAQTEEWLCWCSLPLHRPSVWLVCNQRGTTNRTRCCPPENTRGRKWPSQYSRTACCMSVAAAVWGLQKSHQICAIRNIRVVINDLFSLWNLLMRLLISTYKFNESLAPSSLNEKKAAYTTRIEINLHYANFTNDLTCLHWIYFYFYDLWPISWTIWHRMPITVAARSRAWTIFAPSDSGIVGSNPIQGMDVCICIALCIGTASRRAYHSSKESYRLCKKLLRNWWRGQGPVRAVWAIEKKN